MVDDRPDRAVPRSIARRRWRRTPAPRRHVVGARAGDLAERASPPGWSERAISAPHGGPGLKVRAPTADVTGIMGQADHTSRDLRTTSVPEGLLAELTATPVIRLDEVERGRRHAADRAYDDGDVVVEIAAQLLSLSA